MLCSSKQRKIYAIYKMNGAGAFFSVSKNIDLEEQFITVTTPLNTTTVFNINIFREVIEYIFVEIQLLFTRSDGSIPFKINASRSKLDDIISKMNHVVNVIKKGPHTDLVFVQYQTLLSRVEFHPFVKNKDCIRIMNADVVVIEDETNIVNEYSIPNLNNVKMKANSCQNDDKYLLYDKLSTQFCDFVTKEGLMSLIDEYTSDSTQLNMNTILSFTTKQFNYLKTIYVKDYRILYDVAHFNYLLINMFIKWYMELDKEIDNTCKILYSGGYLLCDRFGVPISNQINENVYLMSFLSTTISRQIASRFQQNSMYVINVPKELTRFLMPINKCSSLADEYEVILPIGTLLRVTKVITRENPTTKRTHYEIHLTLQDYNIDSIQQFKHLFQLSSKTLKSPQMGGAIENAIPVKKSKINYCGFISEQDMHTLKNILGEIAIPIKDNLDKVRDIGNYLCNRLKMACDAKQFTGKYTDLIKQISSCVEECSVLPYVQYNIDTLDTDIGYININKVQSLDNLPFPIRNSIASLSELDKKMKQFYNGTIFTQKKYRHWHLYNLYEKTRDDFQKNIIKTIKQNIVYM